MNARRLVLHQIRYDLKTFFRNPAAVFFTAVLPLIFLFVFVTIFGNETPPGGRYPMSTYYVPGIVGLSVISATFVNLAITLTTLRENGVLKRVRGTPVPPWVFIAGRIGTALLVAFAMTALVTLIGAVVYDVQVPTETLPGVIVTLLVAAPSFCCLGFAVTAIIPSETAAPPITNAIILPLYFISGTFFSVDEAPQWLQNVASYFPVRHFNESLFDAFDPLTPGPGIAGFHLLVIGLWGIAGLGLALRYFMWGPRGTRD